MRKLFLLLIMCLALAGPSFAAVGVQQDGTLITTATDLDFSQNGYVASRTSSVLGLPSTVVGVDDAGYTSITQSTDNISSVAFSFIYKDIPTTNRTGSLPDGNPGMILTVMAATDYGGSWMLMGSTKTGWAGLLFDDIYDSATLLYVDDSIGWVVIASNGLTIQ